MLSVPVGHPFAIGVFSPSVPSLPFPSRRFEVPLWVRAPRLLRVKETCALCPLGTKTLPFPPRYLSRPASRALLPYSSSSALPPHLSILPRVPCSLDTARYQAPSPPLSIFCQRIPDFLIAINVRPIAAPFAALACSNVSAPRFSYLKFRSYPPRSYSRAGFPRFFPIEIDACLFASLSPRVLAPVPPPPPYSTCYSFDLPFRRASLRICA